MQPNLMVAVGVTARKIAEAIRPELTTLSVEPISKFAKYNPTGSDRFLGIYLSDLISLVAH